MTEYEWRSMILSDLDIINIAEKLRGRDMHLNPVALVKEVVEAERILRNSYEKNPDDEFYAMAQGVADYNLPVIRIPHEKYGDMLTIMATEEAIYITKEQAMKFWGLVENDSESN